MSWKIFFDRIIGLNPIKARILKAFFFDISWAGKYFVIESWV